MEKLIGKRIWVFQYDDEPGRHLLMWCVGFDRENGFVLLTTDEDGELELCVNLKNVYELEIFNEGDPNQDARDEPGRLLVFGGWPPKNDEDVN